MFDIYQNYLKENYFYLVKDKNVLEIAPLDGRQTRVILDQNPMSLTLVEADQSMVTQLTEQFPSADVVYEDIFKYFIKKYSYDVVVCCGLLYHLHSPLYLLELIINQANPEYLIIDSANCPNEIAVYDEEEINVLGNFQAINEWKTCNLRTIAHYNTIKKALTNLEYTELSFDNNIERFSSDQTYKKNFWMAIWKKETA